MSRVSWPGSDITSDNNGQLTPERKEEERVGKPATLEWPRQGRQQGGGQDGLPVQQREVQVSDDDDDDDDDDDNNDDDNDDDNNDDDNDYDVDDDVDTC